MPPPKQCQWSMTCQPKTLYILWLASGLMIPQSKELLKVDSIHGHYENEHLISRITNMDCFHQVVGWEHSCCQTGGSLVGVQLPVFALALSFSFFFKTAHPLPKEAIFVSRNSYLWLCAAGEYLAWDTMRPDCVDSTSSGFLWLSWDVLRVRRRIEVVDER